LENKPAIYANVGVKEYFAHDPVGYWKNASTKIKGWRNDNGTANEITPDVRGWLWSNEVNAWLVAEQNYLRLYNRDGEQVLTQAENERLIREEAEEKASFEKLARYETEKRLAELLEKLNRQGIDPDKL
jgi:hypothetical protein